MTGFRRRSRGIELRIRVSRILTCAAAALILTAALAAPFAARLALSLAVSPGRPAAASPADSPTEAPGLAEPVEQKSASGSSASGSAQSGGQSAGLSPIFARDLSGGVFAYSNETGYSPDLSALLAAEYPVKRESFRAASASKAPLVLIIHTHGTECYAPEDASAIPSDASGTRSEDTSKNVVAVGALMAEILNANGVPTIHSEVMHDRESYLHSYERSLETVLAYLEKYPSIKYVLDVHRDSITASDGSWIKPTFRVGESSAAQVMFVVGTDWKGALHSGWTKNLTVAVKLQALLDADYPSLARPINLRGASFNAQYAPGSLLIEVGSCANTLSEAKRAALLTAGALARLISENGGI